MFQRLGEIVSRYWLVTIVIWIVLVIVVRRNTPSWDDVTHDGDLAYMPAYMPSVQGEQLLEQAFPDGRSKSEAIIILSREDREIDLLDLETAKSFVCRMKNLLGASKYAQHQRLLAELEQSDASDDALRQSLTDRAALARQQALEAFDEAVEALAEDKLMARDPYFANAAHNLAVLLFEQRDDRLPEAKQLRGWAWNLNPKLKERPQQIVGGRGELPLLYVWSQYTARLGGKLISRDHRANLIVLGLSNEFMAAENIPFIEDIESLLEETRAELPDWPEGLELGLSGSAAVGSDMLRSAKESMKNTETYTIVLVIAILLIVYRSPLLIAVPLITILASLLVATSLVAQLTQLDQVISGLDWWNFKIFTTTKIFVVVILFGAGTDYCLFLIARYKEELQAGKEKNEAVADALGGVGEALAASAFTTIVGLATMYFAEFGKFRNSGPAIGLCLLVTLIACLTLAPALLRGLGKSVYWVLPAGKLFGGANDLRTPEKPSRFWQWAAKLILAKPLPILLVCTTIMLPFFFVGLSVSITYDLLSELDPDRISKRGAEQLQRHFHVGESGPLVVLAHKPDGDFLAAEGVQAIRNLTSSLYLDGVTAVRSLVSPIGRRSKRGATSLLEHNHRLTQEVYLGKPGALDGDVTRLELVLEHDPFSIEAIQVLQSVDQHLEDLKADDSYWAGSRFLFSGTTAGIRDLRQVTSADNIRIQRLVVLAVFIILLILLRRPAVCIYLILSVLFSYYVTIGATEMWFQWLYGETFEGLDWKVPLFLFVILVAIGQDYNIYLATRVFEEQAEHGLFGGLRQAVVRTGGIITSCGVIMAGTFLSMMTGSLRGIAELGFALTLGVLLDTFVVRPVLVPAFLAILFRWHAHRKQVSDIAKFSTDQQA